MQEGVSSVHDHHILACFSLPTVRVDELLKTMAHRLLHRLTV